ncbi:sulfotransferase [Synechococcus sp. PCC 7336]|uniref:sulfotransferase n=1 Tax=Synechococcus sp. PCC 7336 TaxID=195250 RepID=UPI0003708F71|nr:sulfotransferase [Synechococcus sp. PCC 7336]
MSDYLKDDIFVILCPARSGSTMLVHLLRSHPDIWCNGEIFLHNGKIGALVGNYHQKMLKNPVLRQSLEEDRKDLSKFIYKYAFDSQGRKVAGFKFKHDEFYLSDFVDISQFILRDKDIKIVYLVRENLLKRYLSWYVANYITKITLVADERQRPKVSQVHLDPLECLKDFKKVLDWQESIKQKLDRHRMLEITYEELISKPKDSHQDLCEFLGVSDRRLYTETKKIVQTHVSNVIENYHELKEYFQNTQFASFFE